MPPQTRFAALAIALTTCTLVVSGQANQTPAANQQPSYDSRATAVLVDVVVRDRQGHPVLDLSANDFSLAEDGVAQMLGSFTLVSRGTGIGIGVRLHDPNVPTVVMPTGSTGSDAPAPAAPPVVALVFDALSAESLGLCQQAALQSVKMNGESESQVGVFVTDPGVRQLQRFTTDTSLIRKAVQQVSASGQEAKEVRNERMESLRRRRAEMESSGLTLASANAIAQSGQSGLIGQIEAQRRMIQGEIRMLQAFDDLDRDHRGYGTTNSLLAVFQSMAFLPGRKSIVFFSEGLPASPALQGQLQSLVETANRSNITVYAVDANGLRVRSSMEETRREVEAAGDERLRQATSGLDYSEGPLTKVIERTEDLMRFNGEGGLERLAGDTGGFLVHGTNNVGAALKKIDEDMRFHYLLSYSPTNDVMDGTFRQIAVKVRRPDVTVFARKGYRAVNAPPGVPVLTYEAPALALLDARRLPNAFASQASAFAFPEADRPGLTPIVVRVTTDALQFDIDERKSTYNAQAAVVVRVRDGTGAVVQKLSQQYVLNGDAKDVETARHGEILFYREPELTPGFYQVESVVYDALAEKGSARVSTVVVPGTESPRMRMSSLVLVSRSEQTPGSTEGKGEKKPPFYYGDTLLYPNLGDPLRHGSDSALSFYFVVYTQPGRSTCSAHISLLRNGASIADATRDLPATGTERRLQHVGNLPIGDLPAGVYELRVTVSDSTEQQTRAAFFTVT
jgi:VWFA-related protein